ncbi:MAG: DNA-binding response regulator [SAR116 cluster bacterium]|jgi:two-component system phosphate regulon response regulator OmpR|nr:DNA-binding response regulator [SAR116 cluster bacterium]MBL6768333.1 response regulator transcription factor [Alphaproteobacteria bacterium]RCL78787.1 MAG: DNA-binding response regulator [SAR116 cluster bacterium]CAI8311688.1 MAG: Transcriptional regulatory protein OmpR [SAR116 cluster bacterium]|tara:strand:- start:1034 stop:1738 length:705 start_codon:yes stop_codon:yes gene_type:complete
MANPTDSRSHILVVDDDQRLLELLKKFLEESGFRVTGASDTDQANAYMNGIHFDLLVIDIMMPGKTGIEWLIELRESTTIPAIFLTALGETEDRIDGLSAGADDYLPKPFEPRELILRITRILDRSLTAPNGYSDIIFGNFVFNLESRKLSKDEILIHLTTSEQDLLSCFANAPNKTLSREDLIELLEERMQGRSIDVAIARLRSKIENDPKQPYYLTTVRNLGWKLQIDKVIG